MPSLAGAGCRCWAGLVLELQHVIDFAHGDPAKASFMVASPLAIAYPLGAALTVRGVADWVIDENFAPNV